MNAPLILIVEDTPEILVVLIELLESEGYRVHSAGDGQAAWDYLNNCIRCPDLVITDVMMPRMDGIELIKSIRNDAKLCKLHVALYSASGHYYQVAKGLACEFMLKPFDMTQILETIANCLPKETV